MPSVPGSTLNSDFRSELAVLFPPLLKSLLQLFGMGRDTLGIWGRCGQITIYGFEAGGKLRPGFVHLVQTAFQSSLLLCIEALHEDLVVVLHGMT